MERLYLPAREEINRHSLRDTKIELTFFRGLSRRTRRTEVLPEYEIYCAHALTVLAVGETKGRLVRLERAMIHLERALISDKSSSEERAEAFFLRARVENMLKRYSEAVASIADALKCGLEQKERIFTDDSLANLRDMNGYRETFARMKRKKYK